MTDPTHEIDAPLRTQALLHLCKRLERAWNLSDILSAISPVVQRGLGYCHCWLALLGKKTRNLICNQPRDVGY